jgi:small subunit ribosomal protein S1
MTDPITPEPTTLEVTPEPETTAEILPEASAEAPAAAAEDANVELVAEAVAVPADVAVTSEPEASSEPFTAEPVAAEPVGVEPVGVEPVGVDESAPPAEAGHTETAETEVVAEAPATAADDGLDAGGAMPYQNGDIVPGVVTSVRPDGIDVELDAGRTAVVPLAEYAPGTSFAIGDSTEGTVIRRQGTGRYVLSPKRSVRTRTWARIVAAQESGEILEGLVTESVKGGLIVDLGMRAFLPESLIDVRRVAKPAELIGQSVKVIVIEAVKQADRPGERIVVTRKPLMEKVRAEQRSDLIGSLAPGDRRTGRVTALVPFGAFVDLGGIEGLIHVSELAHRQVATPDEIVKPGDEVDVIVLEVNPEKRKISLSRKKALPDPWQSFQTAHQPGDLVFGTVSGLAAFGAFIKLDDCELEGLVHISELSRHRVESAEEVVAVGEGVWVKILEIVPEKRRLALSLRRALE